MTSHSPPVVTAAEPVCTDNEIKLVGGRTQVEGRLELCVSGQWSTVCNQQWSAQNAAVVCRQLQLDPTGTIRSCIIHQCICDI